MIYKLWLTKYYLDNIFIEDINRLIRYILTSISVTKISPPSYDEYDKNKFSITKLDGCYRRLYHGGENIIYNELSGSDLFLFDCVSDDTQTVIEYADNLPLPRSHGLFKAPNRITYKVMGISNIDNDNIVALNVHLYNYPHIYFHTNDIINGGDDELKCFNYLVPFYKLTGANL